MMEESKSITPFLTFPHNAEEAVNFYISIFPMKKVPAIRRTNKSVK